MKTYYRGKLPHIQPIGATFFVTFRLAGSLPKGYERKLINWHQSEIDKIISKKEENWKELLEIQEKRYFQKFDNALDKRMTEIQYLANPEIANIVSEQLHRFDGELYNLLSYCIMSNHVHLVIDTQLQLEKIAPNVNISNRNYKQLDEIMRRIKGAISRYANLALGKQGQFLARESYDHFVRSPKELERILFYVVNNPVKAGIVKNWKEFPYSFWKGVKV